MKGQRFHNVWRFILGLLEEGVNLWHCGHLHIFLGVTEHLGLVVPLVDGFVSEGSASSVVPAVAIINL